MAYLAALAPYTPQIIGGIGSYKASRSRSTKNPAVPMPDDEEIRRNKRKLSSSRGRASTILTGTEYGLGG